MKTIIVDQNLPTDNYLIHSISMDAERWLGSITLYEAAQIWGQFATSCDPSSLVLWSNVDFKTAQAWAVEHDRKTLTQAMGPLMDKAHPTCRFNFKDVDQWCRYVHAASILFALYISIGTKVTVLTPHPPQRLNPHGDSYYQNIEEPWLTSCCDARYFKIMFAHPTMEVAQNDEYEYWPVDKVKDWVSRYPSTLPKEQWQRHVWNPVEFSEYHAIDLKRERDNIMTKLYIYKTGATIYWGVTVGIWSAQGHRLELICNRAGPILSRNKIVGSKHKTKSEQKAK